MTVSELYKILEEAVKENPQGLIYLEDVWGDLNKATDVTLDEEGDLVVSCF